MLYLKVNFETAQQEDGTVIVSCNGIGKENANI